ncbi:MAG: YcxB family protein [Prosthecobacter sp.]
MTEEITASSILDVPTYLPAFRWARQRKRWARKVLYGVVVTGALIAVWLGVSDGKVEVSDILPSLMALGFLGLVIRRSRDVTGLAQQIQQMPSCGALSTWAIKEDGYEVKTGEVKDFISWTHVFETVSTPDGTLVYLQKDAFEWLPKTAFADASDYNRFLALTAAKTKHSKVG